MHMHSIQGQEFLCIGPLSNAHSGNILIGMMRMSCIYPSIHSVCYSYTCTYTFCVQVHIKDYVNSATYSVPYHPQHTLTYRANSHEISFLFLGWRLSSLLVSGVKKSISFIISFGLSTLDGIAGCLHLSVSNIKAISNYYFYF